MVDVRQLQATLASSSAPALTPNATQLKYAAVITADASLGNVFYLTLTGDCTIEAPIFGKDGQHVIFEIISNGHTVTWGNGWNFGDAGEPALSTGGKTDVISSYYKKSADSWRAGFASGF